MQAAHEAGVLSFVTIVRRPTDPRKGGGMSDQPAPQDVRRFGQARVYSYKYPTGLPSVRKGRMSFRVMI